MFELEGFQTAEGIAQIDSLERDPQMSERLVECGLQRVTKAGHRDQRVSLPRGRYGAGDGQADGLTHVLAAGLGSAVAAGAATAGTVVLLPVTLLWVRRRQHRKPPGRG